MAPPRKYDYSHYCYTHKSRAFVLISLLLSVPRIFTIPANTHGPGPVFFSWQMGSGNFLVTTGYDHVVNIYDRHGERQDQIRLSGMCSGLSWDKDGDVLSVISDHSPVLLLWDSNSRRVTHVDTGLRDTLTFVLWSKNAPLLAVGTSKGNLLIYNHRTSRKVKILGKHNKQITAGAWSEQNYIALIAHDKMLTVSNPDGDTLCQTSLKADPSLVQFSSMKQDDRTAGENTVSLILNKRSLYLLNIYNPDNPIVLAFQDKYGTIVEYKWYGDGFILLAFAEGFFIVISTNLKEIGQELMQVQSHKDNLVHMAACLPRNKIASCGDNIIKIYDLEDLRDVSYVITVDDERSLDWMEWTDDGQLLAASGTEGNLHVYLTSLPILGDTHGSHLALLTSLREVTIIDVSKNEPPLVFPIDVEPSFLAIGPYHISVGMNNRAWFYSLVSRVPMPMQDREYLGTVHGIKINSDYASALIEGKIQLHVIDNDQSENEERESRLFPDGDYTNIRITCHALTDDFLIYATDTGAIQFFSIVDWQIVNDYRHNVGIKQIFPDPSSTRLIVIDDKLEGFIYNPVTDQVITITTFPQTFKGILWDSYIDSKGIFLAYDSRTIFLYSYVRDTVEGPKICLVNQVKIPTGQFPLLHCNGEVTCQTHSGKTITLTVNVAQWEKLKEFSITELEDALHAMMKLRRFQDAWRICLLLSSSEHWKGLAMAAVFDLDINLAIKVYRQLEDVGMVWTLENVKAIEDRNLNAGYMAMFSRKYNEAQSLFLSSSKPSAALEMRKTLLHWDLALQLAEKLAPEQIPLISREYAQQLEFMGDYSNALLHYEKGILGQDMNFDNDDICKAGIARMSIRCSDLRRGITLAHQLKSPNVKRECGEILEAMKQLADAASLYEACSLYDKAAWLYVKLKDWDKVKKLLPNITVPKIHSQYAKIKEADGHFEEAAESFYAAQDFDNVIRIYLDHLSNLDAAVKLVRKTKSVDGAKMIARFFQKLDDMPSAITFLVMSKCHDEAFQLAQSTAKMDVYADAIGEDATLDEFNSIATYYESNKNNLMAGKFFISAGQPKKAVKLLLQVTGAESDDAIRLAVQAVGKAADDQLTRQVIEYLMGDVDGIPKDFRHLFRLYMALNQFKEAGKTAVIIAREEQNAGHFRDAHDVLFRMYKELRKQSIKIPSEMNTNLMLLHSYLLLKIHNKRGDHMNSARLLIRIVNHISKFPAHTIPILLTAVIQCQKAGLNKSAFNFSVILMRPEHRNEVEAKYKKKIEFIIRKAQKTEVDELHSPCPYCGYLVLQSELTCNECRNNLPYCIATGYHIEKDDLTICPNCKFPALFSALKKLLEYESVCPMCSEDLKGENIEIKTDPQQLLYSGNGEKNDTIG